METAMMMPASYNVLSCEEMTYTEGGATATQALLAFFVGPYAWYKANTAIRDYRRENPKDWVNTGMDHFMADSEKSLTNAIYNFSCAFSFLYINLGTAGLGFIPSALIIFS